MTKKLLLSLIALSLFIGCNQPENNTKNDVATEAAEASEKHFELAVYMGRLQRYAEKLHYAGQSQNWVLADFYNHELFETAEEVAEAHIIEDGLNVSELAESIMLPALKNMEEGLKKPDIESFKLSYQAVVNSCNACHAKAEHPYIKIVVPQGMNSYPNQDFRP